MRQAARRSAEARREDVLAAAIVEFAAHGYDATTTAAIAQRAGVSQPYIYALFPDKRAVFLACHERVMHRLGETLVGAAQAVHHPGGGPEVLDRVEVAFRRLVSSDPTQLMFQLQAHAAAGDPQLRAVMRDRFIAVVDEAERATGAPRNVALEQLARGLFHSVALALELPDEYRLGPVAEGPHSTNLSATPSGVSST